MGEPYETPSEYAAAPVRIADDLWYVGNTNVGAHLIDTGEGLILIDTAYPQTLDLLLSSIRESGHDPADIRKILHTHAHYDHIGGTKALVERFGCETYVGREDAPLLGERHELNWHIEYGLPFDEGFAPDVLLDDGDVVRLGHTQIRCIASPGHTMGCMTFVWETAIDGKPCTAALSGGWYPSTARREYLERYGLPDRRDAYLATFERLSKLKVDIMLGSHPVFNDTFAKAARLHGDPRAFVDPDEWARALADGKEEFERALSE